MKTQGTRLVLLALAAAATLHCSGRRERRPVVVAAPAPLPAVTPVPPPGAPNTTPPPPGGDPLANGQQPQPGATPTGPQPAPGTTPTGPATLPPMTITTATDDGKTIILEWDGKAYKGNDKWDVAPQ